MRSRKPLILVFLSALALLAIYWPFTPAHRATVSVHTASGPRNYAVELATTPQAQERGLMFRKTLPAGHGMLFIFPRPQVMQFWMKDTYIPLDIIFIGADNRVVHIAANAKPKSLDSISSIAPAQRVLEVPAGTARQEGITVGNDVTYE